MSFFRKISDCSSEIAKSQVSSEFGKFNRIIHKNLVPGSIETLALRHLSEIYTVYCQCNDSLSRIHCHRIERQDVSLAVECTVITGNRTHLKILRKLK